MIWFDRPTRIVNRFCISLNINLKTREGVNHPCTKVLIDNYGKNMTTYLYVMRSGKHENSPIKIGVSNNPKLRLGSLQVGNPVKIKLLHSIPMPTKLYAYHCEKKLHKAFKKYRLCGEWFNGSVLKKLRLKRLIDNYDEVKFRKKYNYVPMLEKNYEDQLSILSEANKRI